MSSPLQSIVNVKAAVQTKERPLYDIRNHYKARAILYPDTKVNAPWTVDNIITFTMNSADMPYINMNSSLLWVRMNFRYNGAVDTPNENFIQWKDISRMFSRMRVLNAGAILEDIINYGYYMSNHRRFHQRQGPYSESNGHLMPQSGQREFYDLDQRFYINNTIQTNDTGTARNPLFVDDTVNTDGVWLCVPFTSFLDGLQPSMYLPMYMLATKLQLEFTFDHWWKMVVAYNEGPDSPTEGELLDKMSYTVYDAYIETIGLRTLEGAILTPLPFTFKSIGVHSKTQQIAGGKTTYDFNMDISRSSIKDAIHQFRPTSEKAFSVSANKTVSSMNSYMGYSMASTLDRYNDYKIPTTVIATEFSGYLGGTIYPFPRPLNMRDCYTQFERYRSQVDNGAMPMSLLNPFINYGTYTGDLLPGEDRYEGVRCFYPIVIYSTLDQVNTIVSGMDTDRYDVGWRITLNESLKNTKFWDVFVEYWMICTIAGGKINIEE